MCQFYVSPVGPSIERLVFEVGGLAEDAKNVVLRIEPESQLDQILKMWSGNPEIQDAHWTALYEIYGLPVTCVEERKAPEWQLHFWSALRDVLNRAISAASLPVATVFIKPLEDLPAADAPAQDPEAKWSVP